MKRWSEWDLNDSFTWNRYCKKYFLWPKEKKKTKIFLFLTKKFVNWTQKWTCKLKYYQFDILYNTQQMTNLKRFLCWFKLIAWKVEGSQYVTMCCIGVALCLHWFHDPFTTICLKWMMSRVECFLDRKSSVMGRNFLKVKRKRGAWWFV